MKRQTPGSLRLNTLPSYIYVYLNRVSTERSGAGAGARNLRAVGIAWVKISRDVRRIRPSVRSGRLRVKNVGVREKPSSDPRKTCLHKSLL